MGVTKEATIDIEVTEGEDFCASCEGIVGWRHGVECVVTWELYKYQAHTVIQ